MKKKNPVISVIIPVYNTELYIKDTIMSLVNQSFKDFEILLIDDGSSDNSSNIAESILCSTEIDYKIINQTNKGQGISRNIGVENSNGNWLYFLDSDDIISPFTFEIAYNVLNQNYKIDLLFSKFKNIDLKDVKNLIHSKITDCSLKTFNKSLIQEEFLKRNEIVLVPGTFYNAEWYKIHNFRFKNIPYSEDILFMWEILFFVKNVAKLNCTTYFYLHRPNSIMTSSKYDKIIKGYESFIEIQKKYFENKDNNRFTRNFLLSRWVLGVMNSSSKLLKFEDYMNLYRNFNAHSHLKKLKSFPSRKVQFISQLILVFPKLSYYLLRKL